MTVKGKTKLEREADLIYRAWRKRHYAGQSVPGDRLSVAAGWVTSGRMRAHREDYNGRDDHWINAVEIMNSRRPLDWDWRKDPDFHV